MRPLVPSFALRAFLLVVDIGFVLYWVVTSLHLLPPAWLYAHHDDAVMRAWNGSFLPLDLLASATGLSGLAAARKGDARWPLLALVSLALTSASGLNAIAFWALRHDFDIAWWLPNLVLLLGPLPLGYRIWRDQHEPR